MNRTNSMIFDNLSTSTAIYKASIKASLEKFTVAKESAKRQAADYKDESGKFEELMTPIKSATKEAIGGAGRRYAKDCREYSKQLERELGEHLKEVLSPDFVRKLDTFRNYHITPSKTELDVLLALNSNNSIGLRALKSLLDEQGAAYRLNVRDVSEYEEDIKQLTHLAAMVEAVPMFDVGDLPVATPLYRGDTMKRVRQDNSVYEDGSRIGFEDLHLYGRSAEAILSRLESAQSAWTKDVTNIIEERLDREAVAQETVKGKPITTPDVESSTSIAEVVAQNSGEALAADLGREQAAQAAQMQRIVQSYAR